MSEYIDRKVVLNILASKNAPWDGYQKVADLRIADVVSKAAYDQVAWERNLAEEQLKSIGKSLGEKMDDVQPVNWIPVTERLPESVCKSYLCLTDTGYHCEVRWTNNVYGLWESDDKWGWSIVDVPQYCKVTHWMPLPEPPKDGET